MSKFFKVLKVAGDVVEIIVANEKPAIINSKTNSQHPTKKREPFKRTTLYKVLGFN